MTLIELHECFASFLPKMQCLAQQHFRNVDAERRDEAVQNTLCLVWKYASALVRNGRMSDPGMLASVLLRTSPDQIGPNHPGERKD